MLEVHVEEFMNQPVNCGTMQHSVQEVPQELILLPQHWQHLNRLVRRAERKIKTTYH